jgi:hypothetical protein
LIDQLQELQAPQEVPSLLLLAQLSPLKETDISSSERDMAQTDQDRVPRKGQVEAVVRLLDGKDFRAFVSGKLLGQQLFDEVIKFLDIEEKDYFSLYFKEGNHRIFLDHEKPLKKQLTETTHSDERGKWPQYELHFGVKYYVGDPSSLREEMTRYYYCLQVCQDVRENRILHSREVVMELLSLLIQSSAGDYDRLDHPPGYTEEFMKFLYLNTETLPVDFELNLTEMHKSSAGLTPERAEFQFLSIAKKQLRYGMHLYAVRDSDDSSLVLGVNGEGIYLWNHNRVKETFNWPDVVKISYKRSRFRIRHSVETPGVKKKEVVIIDLTCGDSKAAKRIWKTCIDQHTFFRLREPPPRPRVTLPFQRNRHGFSGRTLDQMRRAKHRGNQPGFTRSYSNRYVGRTIQSYDVEKRNWFPGDDHWIMKPSRVAPVEIKSGQIIINFLLKGATTPFEKVEKHTLRYNIGKKDGEGKFSVTTVAPPKQPGRRAASLSTSTTPTSTLQRQSSANRRDFTPALESPMSPGSTLPPWQQTAQSSNMNDLRSRSRSIEAISSTPKEISPYATTHSLNRPSSREKTPPDVAPKPKGTVQYAKVNKDKRSKSSSPPTSPPPPPPGVELSIEAVDFSVLDQEGKGPSHTANNPISVTTKKTDIPSPPQRGSSSSANAIAVK